MGSDDGRYGRGALAVAAALAAFALLLYLRTLAPGLLQDDSGELQTLARLPGHTHPTGYPVYLALARAFTWLPVGSAALCVSALSAALAALAVGAVYLAGLTLSGHRGGAAAGALALAVSPAFWSQAVIAEIYPAGARAELAARPVLATLATRKVVSPRYRNEPERFGPLTLYRLSSGY